MRFVLLFFFLSACSNLETKPETRTAAQAVSDFYRDFMSTKRKVMEEHFSKSFDELSELNDQTCASRPGSDICGWNSDGKIYLNSSEVDPKLSFENSKFSAVETEPGLVDVTLNVLPSQRAKTNSTYYIRKLRYRMVRDEGKWAIDDILVNGKSIRKQMEHEIKFYYLKK